MKNQSITTLYTLLLSIALHQSILLGEITEIETRRQINKNQLNSRRHLANLVEEGKKNFVFLRSREVGMFSIFGDVLCLCKKFEVGLHEGFEVDFLQSGLYYDEKYGDNWWNYYCEPLLVFRETSEIVHVCELLGYPNNVQITEHELGREEASSLIERYIHIKEEILSQVNEFITQNFIGHYVISVHYRGTDKIKEAPAVVFDDVNKCILKLIDENYGEKVKIFLATDDESFFLFMKENFGDKICYNLSVVRSTSSLPIHLSNENPYQSGKDALIDCLLLSRGSVLVRTSSNLSLWSSFFNPTIPVIELSKRHQKY